MTLCSSQPLCTVAVYSKHASDLKMSISMDSEDSVQLTAHMRSCRLEQLRG